MLLYIRVKLVTLLDKGRTKEWSFNPSLFDLIELWITSWVSRLIFVSHEETILLLSNCAITIYLFNHIYSLSLYSKGFLTKKFSKKCFTKLHLGLSHPGNLLWISPYLTDQEDSSTSYYVRKFIATKNVLIMLANIKQVSILCLLENKKQFLWAMLFNLS